MCNLFDLKPAVFAQGLPANNLVRFSDDFGGETNVYQGFDINLESRFANGAFIRGGITAGTRTFDNCNLQNAGFDAAPAAASSCSPKSTPTARRTAIATIRIGPT